MLEGKISNKNNGHAGSKSTKVSNLELIICQPDLPGIPAVTATCRRCQATFEAPAHRGQGRPIAFCSPACRTAAASAQKSAWQTENPPGGDRRSAITCLTCGEPFAAEPSTAGRVPRFCSAACRRAGRRKSADRPRRALP